jgi:hypothetical protein
MRIFLGSALSALAAGRVVATRLRRLRQWPATGEHHDRFFAVETLTCTVGLSPRAEAGFRFYASHHASMCLEGRSCNGLEDIQSPHSAFRRCTAGYLRHPGTPACAAGEAADHPDV